MMVKPRATALPQGGLADLDRVELDARRQAMLDAALARCGGPLVWQLRKEAEARDLLALAHLGPRLDVLDLDLQETLRARLALRAPVPCKPGPDGALRVAPFALLALAYREQAMLLPQPGFVFVQVLEPRGVWHANVAMDPFQPLCLGARLPAGIPVKELVLMTFGALTLQTAQLDARDPAGILNAEAARWWIERRDQCPLTRASFLDPCD